MTCAVDSAILDIYIIFNISFCHTQMELKNSGLWHSVATWLLISHHFHLPSLTLPGVCYGRRRKIIFSLSVSLSIRLSVSLSGLLKRKPYNKNIYFPWISFGHDATYLLIHQDFTDLSKKINPSSITAHNTNAKPIIAIFLMFSLAQDAVLPYLFTVFNRTYSRLNWNEVPATQYHIRLYLKAYTDKRTAGRNSCTPS